jgi:hypothetical protein
MPKPDKIPLMATAKSSFAIPGCGFFINYQKIQRRPMT